MGAKASQSISAVIKKIVGRQGKDGENSQTANMGEQDGVYTRLKGMQGMKGKENKRDKEEQREEKKTKSGEVNREEGEGLPGDSGFCCICYQFAQKCQHTVTFSPTASLLPNHYCVRHTDTQIVEERRLTKNEHMQNTQHMHIHKSIP